MKKEKRSPAELRNMFGANLRELSRQYPSISELTRQLGINRTQFNRYLSGESFPRPDVLDRICTFFGVDARILLEPVGEIETPNAALSNPFLKDFLGEGINTLTEDQFPSGFYRFFRQSFLNADRFITGLVFVFREGGATYVRGYEPKSGMRLQGLPTTPEAREFRGFVMRLEDGVALMISHRKAMTCSFNYLSRAASFDNNYWVGYVTRTVRESVSSTRVTRMVYEHLGHDLGQALAAAHDAGFKSAEDLTLYVRGQLQVGEPFR
ncbi:helix-turn-helix domain-containing protein [Jhaorihella thermophila]|uniref:Cro/C1-type HTH DNA-binding domain-containing protein n=2 Tax=Jhaorihella thermophila TaxID=488547 RepID=A0A1H5TAZ1_9RHOB|nr:helix-turn-helix transcriptional regulator [Jhaorihella thermophila]SEF59995.1 Cro/C1-type HTH DNA-binding domain-containing protein [Jhaorihella thermophila]